MAHLIVSIVVLRQSLQFPFSGMGKPLVAIASASAAGAFAAMYIQHSFPSLLGLCLAVITGIAVTATIVWRLNTAFELKLTKDIGRAFPKVAALLPGFEG